MKFKPNDVVLTIDNKGINGFAKDHWSEKLKVGEIAVIKSEEDSCNCVSVEIADYPHLDNGYWQHKSNFIKIGVL